MGGVLWEWGGGRVTRVGFCKGDPKQAPLTTPRAFLWRDACVKDLGTCLSTDVLFR